MLSQTTLSRENSILAQEINNLNAELELRKKLSDKAALFNLERHYFLFW